MEDFSAEEEEPWYDQQDLEQGKRVGEGSGVCPATPVRYSIVGRDHPGKGRTGPGAAFPTESSDASGEWGHTERVTAWGDPDRAEGDLQKCGG
jgi:hypothetical protein